MVRQRQTGAEAREKTNLDTRYEWGEEVPGRGTRGGTKKPRKHRQ